MREGFWCSSFEPNLPVPVPNDESWPGQALFLRKLFTVQSKAPHVAFRGWSRCRLCGQANGNKEFTEVINGQAWTWPEGFRHYVLEHNVRPSLAFQEFIIGEEIK